MKIVETMLSKSEEDSKWSYINLIVLHHESSSS